MRIFNPGFAAVPAIRTSLSAWPRSRSAVRAPSLRSRVEMLLAAARAAGAVRLRVETPDGHVFQIDFPSATLAQALAQDGERNDFDEIDLRSKRARQ